MTVKDGKKLLRNKGYTTGELFRMTGWEILVLARRYLDIK